MGPRKRSKPNPQAEAVAESESLAVHHTAKSEVETQKQPAPSTSESPPTPKPDPSDKAVTADNGTVTQPSNRTWYGGTWSRKSTPVAQVAKESISAATNGVTAAVGSPRIHKSQLPTTPLKSPAMYLSRSKEGSSRSLPLAATTTMLNITSNAQKSEDSTSSKGQPSESEAVHLYELPPDVKINTVAEKAEPQASDQDPSISRDSGNNVKDKPLENLKSDRDSASWLNWFSRVETPNKETKGRPLSPLNTEGTIDASKNCPPNADSQEVLDERPRRSSDPSPVSYKAQQDPPPRSWLGLWGKAPTQSQNSEPINASGENVNKSVKLNEPPTQSSQPENTSIDPIPDSQSSPPPTDAGKSYGWTFWSKDTSKDDKEKSQENSNLGELAQGGLESQSKPEAAIMDETRGVPTKVEKNKRPQASHMHGNTKKPKSVDETGKIDKISNSPTITPKGKLVSQPNSMAKRLQENLLLPPINLTYSPAGRPSLIQQLGRLLQLNSDPEEKHVAITQSPYRIKRALVIGVHGYFPAPLIRSVLGQPTGTSIRFANSAAQAILKWAQDQGYSCEVEKVALEGEGKVADRTDLLWKLLLNWIEKIRRADFLMIACHSQGVPVAMMLLAKLIAFGCVNSTKIGVCAMAGVNLGPFADYKSRWISGSAGELFEFAQPDSQVSKDYEAALDVSLKFGAKLVYIGSIDDQLVSLESSTFGTISHPHIYRAVFVDGRIHAPDFLTHLVGFALKLRNLGISDHGLIRELSTPLAGSLYTGEGHSRIYEDEAVYYLAVDHALRTTALGNVPMQVDRKTPAASQNPYILPFAMRGLLEEDQVRTGLYGEITELIKQFDDWKPSSKVLKDVKFRLEGVRSKL